MSTPAKPKAARPRKPRPPKATPPPAAVVPPKPAFTLLDGTPPPDQLEPPFRSASLDRDWAELSRPLPVSRRGDAE